MKSLKDISFYLSFPSDKDTSHNYLPVYQKEFNQVKDVKILEIGVCYGGSLVLWNEFFIDSEIHGIDNLKYTEKIIPGTMHWGNYEDLHNDFEDNYFDYIVNDSMHYAKEQIDAFNLYYPKVKSGGKFFMEDVPNMDSVAEIAKSLEGHNFRVWNMNKTSISQDSMILVVYKP